MGWLPWSSSSSHTPPTVLPEEPAKPQETASQNASSTVPSDRTPRPLPNPPNPLGPIEGAFIPEGSVPRLRRVFAGFMNEQATPFVRPLAASPWPAYSIASLTFASALKSGLGLPPAAALLFSGAFATSGYVLQSGDVENGAGIFTWWAGSYLGLRSLLKTRAKRAAREAGPVVVRTPGAHALSAAVGAAGCVYAAEYFWFRKEDAVKDAERPVWMGSS